MHDLAVEVVLEQFGVDVRNGFFVISFHLKECVAVLGLGDANDLVIYFLELESVSAALEALVHLCILLILFEADDAVVGVDVLCDFIEHGLGVLGYLVDLLN